MGAPAVRGRGQRWFVLPRDGVGCCRAGGGLGAVPVLGWGQWLCWDGGSSCEHSGAVACESFSQPWLLVMPGETETRFVWGIQSDGGCRAARGRDQCKCYGAVCRLQRAARALGMRIIDASGVPVRWRVSVTLSVTSCGLLSHPLASFPLCPPKIS